MVWWRESGCGQHHVCEVLAVPYDALKEGRQIFNHAMAADTDVDLESVRLERQLTRERGHPMAVLSATTLTGLIIPVEGDGGVET